MFDGYIQIGNIVKVHGLKGELILESPFDELPDSISLIYAGKEGRQLSPYRLETLQSRPKSGRNLFFLKLENVDTRSDAEALIRSDVYCAENDIPEHSPLWEEDLDIIGWQITDNDNHFGEVVDVFETPAHFIIEINHKSGSVLVPWVEEYITELDEENHTVIAQNLDRFL